MGDASLSPTLQRLREIERGSDFAQRREAIFRAFVTGREISPDGAGIVVALYKTDLVLSAMSYLAQTGRYPLPHNWRVQASPWNGSQPLDIDVIWGMIATGGTAICTIYGLKVTNAFEMARS